MIQVYTLHILDLNYTPSPLDREYPPNMIVIGRFDQYILDSLDNQETLYIHPHTVYLHKFLHHYILHLHYSQIHRIQLRDHRASIPHYYMS
jgi:hypothetical protein